MSSAKEIELLKEKMLQNRENQTRYRERIPSLGNIPRRCFPILYGEPQFPKCYIGFLCTAGIIAVIILSSYLAYSSISIRSSFEYRQRCNVTKVMMDLVELGQIAPRPIGSHENEYEAVEFLKNRLVEIQKDAYEWNNIDIDIQVVDGSFLANSYRETYYEGVQNVVAKLYSRNNTNESILVNCHFDTGFVTPGVSDIGLNCVTMLEVLRVLSRSNTLMKNVVFLFNGAREDGLQGSHGFITKHKWAKEVICFVNLEGAGGHPMLLQTAPQTFILPKLYADSVRYPRATILIDEFQNGGFSPNTDFANFRDYGKLKGLDLVQSGSIQVSQRLRDDIPVTNENNVQIFGDNLLALIGKLVEYDNLKEKITNDTEQAIYFDIFGKFVTCYKASEGRIINICVLVMSIISMLFNLYNIFYPEPLGVVLRHVSINAIFIGIGIIASYGVLYGLTEIVNINKAQMIWFANQWFAFTYYGCAVVFTMMLTVYLRRVLVLSYLNKEEETSVFIIIFQLMVTILFLRDALYDSRDSYLLGIGLVGVSISHYVVNGTGLKSKRLLYKFSACVIINSLALGYLAYVLIPTYQMTIPMLGRMGGGGPTELSFAVQFVFPVIIMFGYFIPLVLFFNGIVPLLLIFASAYIIQIVVLQYGLLHPFSNSAMQRFEVMHISRRLAHVDDTGKNQSYGYLVEPNDIRGGETLSKIFPNEVFEQLLNTEECFRELFCGVPVLYSPYFSHQAYSYWSPREAPKISINKQFQYVVEDNSTHKFFDVTLKGSKFMDLVIFPLNGAQLCEWSLNPANFNNTLRWWNHPAYYIRYHQGSISLKETSLKLEFNVVGMTNRTDYVVKLAWSVYHYSNTNDSFTPEFLDFIQRFPSWSNVVPAVVDYEEYLLL